MYGVLRTPWHAPRPPVVILIPGLDSVKEELHTYGDDFLRRGMAVLAIDGPGQGEMEFRHPMRFDYETPVRHAIDYLETRHDVDAGRIGLMGSAWAATTRRARPPSTRVSKRSSRSREATVLPSTSICSPRSHAPPSPTVLEPRMKRQRASCWSGLHYRV